MLRDYQQYAVDTAINFAKYRDEPAIVVIPTGGGKSHIIAKLAEHYKAEGKRVAVIAHRKELLEQNGSKLNVDFGYYSASLGGDDLDSDIILAGVASIYNKDFKPFDVILYDECFVAGTLIKTKDGDKDISCVKENDLVLCATGYNRVISTFSKKANNLYEIKLSSGNTIKCTGNHPFFTEEGWTEARYLGEGANLYSEEKLCELWGGYFPKEKPSLLRVEKNKILLQLLCEEIRKPNDEHCICEENVRNLKEDRTQAYKKNGEWNRFNNTSTTHIRYIAKRVDSRISNSHLSKAWHGLSSLLQNGFSKFRKNDCDRNRWGKSLWEEKDFRYEKGQIFDFVRVESITPYKCTGVERVYNIGVEGHPSYFANGVLVHNCQHLPNNKMGQGWAFIDKSPQAKLIGFTATPYRLAGGKLNWGKIVYTITYAELLERGFLTKITNKSSGNLDLSEIDIVAGDYSEAMLSEYMSDPVLIEAAVKNIISYGAGREYILIFCVTVVHAKILTECMQKNGLQSFCIDGKTPKAEREQAIKDFKEGRLKHLINVQVFTEGFDAPELDMIVCLRPTKSKALWEQILGRGVRIAEGKKDCLLVDMAGNLMEHGGIGTPYHEKAKNERELPKGKICPQCEGFTKTSARECPDCGFQFPEPETKQANHDDTANMYSSAVYKSIERYAVRGVVYREHTNKKNGNVSLRVDYIIPEVKYGVVSEWLSVHHDNDFVRNKAFKFFEERGCKPPIDTKSLGMELLIEMAQGLKKPTFITVDSSDKFPRITHYEYASGESDTGCSGELLEDDFIQF